MTRAVPYDPDALWDSHMTKMMIQIWIPNCAKCGNQNVNTDLLRHCVQICC